MSTYREIESSIALGAPYELYLFQRGSVKFTYTSYDSAITYSTDTYAPVSLSRGSFNDSAEGSAGELEIRVGRDLPAIADFISNRASMPLWLTIFRSHVAMSGNPVVMWLGQVKDVQFEDAEAVLTCIVIRQAMEQVVPRWNYQNTCNNALYDANCTLNKNSFKSSGTVSTIAGQIITASLSPAQTAPYFKTGMLVFNGIETFVLDHSGANLKLMFIPQGMIVGSAIDVYAGCDRNQATCKNKFNNMPNFNGFPYVPNRNPFEGLI